MNQWYQELKKPTWAPPSKLFGPVWSVLYLIIFISYGYVFYLFFQAEIGWIEILPFLMNILFNLAFTPIQFTLRNNYLALIDILLTLVTLLWALITIYPIAPWVTWINSAYLLWVAFASALQLAITWLNHKPI